MGFNSGFKGLRVFENKDTEEDIWASDGPVNRGAEKTT